MLVRASCSLGLVAWWIGSLFCTLDKNSRSLCSCTPFVLSTCEHHKRGLLLVLSRRIPVRCAHARLLFYPFASTMNGVLFLSSWEELQLVVLKCASCFLSLQELQTGYYSRPLDNNFRSLCSLFGYRQIRIPNLDPVTKIQSCGCEIIRAGAQWCQCNSYNNKI